MLVFLPVLRRYGVTRLAVSSYNFRPYSNNQPATGEGGQAAALADKVKILDGCSNE